MDKYSNQDHYLDPISRILKNRLGITDQNTLEEAEASFVSWRGYDLLQNPIPGEFNLKLLQAIHKYLFCDLYDWAGELRTIDISKGGNYFAHHTHIPAAAKIIFEGLKQENYLRGLNIEQFCNRSAYYLSEINVLHPFREGNGRAQRLFLTLLAQQAGYRMNWHSLEQQELLQASVVAFSGDTLALTRLLERIVTT